MESKYDKESQEYVTCPYDKSHRILKKRLQVHLNRCRRNHKDANKLVCPFNTIHVIDAAEMDSHLESCSSRGAFESHKQLEQSPRASTSRANQVAPAPTPEVTCKEDWDLEPDEGNYNPQKNLLDRRVVRTLQGATKKQKKEFRKAERMRFLNLQQQQKQQQQQEQPKTERAQSKNNKTH